MTRENYIHNLQSMINDAEDMGLYNEDVESLQVAIKALEQEPCEDAISRQAVFDATVKKNSIWNKITNSKGENLEEIISQLPPVNPQQKTGHWVDGEYCSECGCDVPAYIIDWKWQKDMDAKWCPMCGAKMESECK